MASFDKLVEASFLASDAGANICHATGVRLVGPLGIRKQRASEHDHIGVAIAKGAFGNVGVAQLTHRDNGYGKAGIGSDIVGGKALPNGARHGNEAACGHARRRVGHPPVVIATKVDVKDVYSRRHELFHIAQGLFDGTAAAHASQIGRIHDLLVIGFLECKRKVDAVHDGVVGPNAATDFFDHIEAKLTPIGITSELAMVKGGVSELLDKITFVSVQIDAIDAHGMGIGRRLADTVYDTAQLLVREAHAWNGWDVVVRQETRRDRKLLLRDEALRVAHAAESSRKLDKNARSEGMDTLGKVAPACHNGSASIDAREIGELVQLGDRGIDAVAYRYESCCDEAAAAFGAGEKVLQHHVAGATSFLAHVDIAHRRHDDAVFDGELVNFDGREELVKRIELLCHAGQSATGICGGPAVE